MTESTTPEDSSKTPAAQKKPAKAYSCIRCFERKVKCDRESPCSNCSKSNAECVFRVPPAPRRRKKRTQEEILKARLEHYETILRSKGIDVYQDNVKPEDLPPELSPEEASAATHSRSPSEVGISGAAIRSGSMIPSRAFVSGKLIVDKNKSRFVENNLWTSLSDEFRKPSDAMPDSSDDEDDEDVVDDGLDYMIGLTPSSQTMRDLHPLPEQVPTLWQIFLENINPLSKLVHVPTIQPAVFEASSHLERLPKPFEALLFAIYSAAVMSLRDTECENMLGERKSVLLGRYRNGTKRALARAKFLGTCDLMVLQALTLHLLSMREVYDARTLWTLTGVAKRIAEGMGVHRDGSNIGLGPFETEMRRRLWWQITFHDFRTAELAGSGNFHNMNLWDCRIPSNVNDSDIWPGMKEITETQERGTEMVFCMTRYEIGRFWKTKMLTRQPHGDFATVWHNFRNTASIEDKSKHIDELERLLEHKYVRFCDPSSPVEFMAILVTRAATNGMRLMTHHPRRYEKDEDIPESEKTLVWGLAIKLLEIDNLLHTSKPMQRFQWHSENYFQWQALIYVLSELRKDPISEHADRGWDHVHEIYSNHTKFVTDMKLPICFAIGGLCLKAWKAREDSWAQRMYGVPLHTPKYIGQLRQAREERNVATATATTPLPTAVRQNQQTDYFAPMAMNSLPMQPRSQTELAPTFETVGENTNTGAMMPPPSTQQQKQQLQQQHHEQQQQMQAQYVPTTQQQQQQQQEAVTGMAAQQSLPAEFQFQMQQQPQYFWWDYQSMSNANATPVDLDFSMMNLPSQDAMDWSQWDQLLQNVSTG